ncbi:MAG TPA: nickel pincer cofactor biosynthesis protein LarB [Natronoarchaeum rubrum]|nr:nickel pincer cofactor biosynthesis protein LarB [Natronoarchaeum rubrum]
MRELLDAVASGEVSPAEAEARLAGYATTDAGRFDAAREQRRGVPEAVYAEGKTADEVVDMLLASLETTGRGIATRVSDEQVATVRDALDDARLDADVRWRDRAGVLILHAPDYEPPDVDATVRVVTGGTVDRGPAGEARAIAAEMGAAVELVEDVGVAGIDRLLDRVDKLREADVLVVAAGREGALPTVVAGLVDTPVIGLPTNSGYGHGGDGEAALLGMLQSCTVLSTVNVDAGFVAGAQAGLIARAIDGH